jgi:nitrite reductase/ring-hydroxylating ferredoxin subunit
VSTHPETYVRAARLADVRANGCLPVQVAGRALALFAWGDRVFAVDNRCPHMGFPLHRGTLHDGILTCHWHHARFDLATGGTFDQFADDVMVFPVQVRSGDVWVDLRMRGDPRAHQRARLRDGLERNIPLVISKAVLALLTEDGDPVEPYRIGLQFGVRYRQAGWGPGLTIHTCLWNVLPQIAGDDRPRALYHGLAAVAADCDGMPPRFTLRPLPATSGDPETLKRWFRQFVEVRDAEGAERCVVSAVRAGATPAQMADMFHAAATDHRYIETGHVLDFTNKAFESLESAGWDEAENVLASLVSAYASAERMEESNEWRHPVDLVALLEGTFEKVPAALEAGRPHRGAWGRRTDLLPVLLGEDAGASVGGLLEALREGATEEDVAAAVAFAAALRIAHFPQSNEFGDWDTALHTFTFANAVHQSIRRSPSPELLRAVFDAAMSVYLDRFLNVPSVPLPSGEAIGGDPEAVLRELPALLDRRQQVNEAGAAVATYLSGGGDPPRLLAAIGRLLLREDRNFHTIQAVEAAFRQFGSLQSTPDGVAVLVAAARYLAAHSPTVRAQGQTYEIARRLARGENIYENAGL